MSVIRFFSEAAGEVIMLRSTVEPVFKQAGIIFHDQGAFLSEDLAVFMEKIQRTIDRLVQFEVVPKEENEEELDEEKKQKRKDFVALRIRFYPLMDLLQKAQKKGKHVHWTTL